MSEIKLIILFGPMLLLTQVTKAQIPINDPAWNLQPSGTSGGTEEFNSATIDYTNKWFNQYPWGAYNNGAERNLPANLIHGASDTTLKIKADTLLSSVLRTPSPYNNVWANGTTYVYQSGAIQSRKYGAGATDVYKYGYLEISAKYPTGSYPLWPAFWVWSANCPNNFGSDFYNEIDICENGAPDSYAGNVMGTNLHVETTTCNTIFQFSDTFNVGQTISNGFHKYAVQWAPDRIIWYFNDLPIRSFYDTNGDSIPQEKMAVILNFAIDPWWAMLPADWNNDTIFPNNPQHEYRPPVIWPKYFEIDYLRYYKLNTACVTDLTICTPSTDYSSRAVERTIMTGGACSPTFNGSTPSTSYTLRATTSVTLDAGTTVDPTGTGYFAIELLACPQ